LEAGLSPPSGTAPLNSDVTAWRYAWKLAQSTPLSPDTPQEGDMVNIFVVDQNNQPIVFYATGKKEILNAYTLPESTDI
jgi:hypothetical protein